MKTRVWNILALALMFLTFHLASGQSITSDYGLVENKGQFVSSTQDEILFCYESGGLQVFVLPDGLAYQFCRMHEPEELTAALADPLMPIEDVDLQKIRDETRVETYRVDLKWLGSNADVEVVPSNEAKDPIHFYNRGVTNVNHFGSVLIGNLYDGIDWKIYLKDGQLKYDFIVHPGADPDQIKGLFNWAEKTSLSQTGDLKLETFMGSIFDSAPVAFQGEQELKCTYQLLEDTLRFSLGTFDPTQSVTIDPTVIWATYYGGTGTEFGYDCETDGLGNIYFTGQASYSYNLSFGGHQNFYGGGSRDLFLVKFTPDGDRVWATYYGGSGSDFCHESVVNGVGDIVMVGTTDSDENIGYMGHDTVHNAGNLDGLIVKFDSNGYRLWGSYYGAGAPDAVTCVAMDSSDNIFFGGYTGSTTQIAVSGHQNSHGGDLYDAFLVKFNASGERQWGTYYGGSLEDQGFSISTNTLGDIFLSGRTESSNNISHLGHQNIYGGGDFDSFLVRFNAAGQRIWGTYYGGNGRDWGMSNFGNDSTRVYLYGRTSSTSGIAYNGHQNSYGGNFADAYLVKFDIDGTRMWSTYYGGSEDDHPGKCVLDPLENIYFCGNTESSSGIAYNGYQNIHGGEKDAFIAKFDSSGTRIWCTYHGGSEDDYALRLELDPFGSLYLAGTSASSSNVQNNGFQDTLGGDDDGLLIKLDVCSTYETVIVETCDQYTFGGNTYDSSGVYYDTTQNILGCPNFQELQLNILDDHVSDFQISCGPYSWPGTGNTYSQSGTYTSYFTNQFGCDSVVDLNLTVQANSQFQLDTTVCDSYTSPDGSIYTTSDFYQSVIPNAIGCDSLIQIDLTVHQSNLSLTQVTACESYIWNQSQYFQSGTYQFQTTTTQGCDSIATLELEIGLPDSSTTQVTACKAYEWNGALYVQTGVYGHATQTALGCDSSAVLDLTILPDIDAVDPTDTTVSIGNTGLFSTHIPTSFPSYQWQQLQGGYFIDVVNGGQYVNATEEILSILNTTNANDGEIFRCIVNSEVCQDTTESAVLNILDDTGVEDAELDFAIRFDANLNSIMLIGAGLHLQNALSLNVLDLSGKLVYAKEIVTGTSAPIRIELPDLRAEMYLVQLSDKDRVLTAGKLVIP